MDEEKKEYYKRVLTGNYYFNATLFGLILYVEVEHHFTPDVCARSEFEKAKLTDLYTLGLASSPTIRQAIAT